MKRTTLCLILALFLAGGLIAGDTPTLEDYLGRWNLKILDSGDSFFSAWLKIEEKDGKPQGQMVWKWGSVGGIQKIQVKDGILSFSRGKGRFTAELSGGELKGSGGGKKFIGKRAHEMCDVSGTWTVVPVDLPEAQPGTLIFKTDKQGKITGKAIDPQGEDLPLKNIKLKGYTLTCVCPMKEYSANLKLEMRGDRIAGNVSMTMPNEKSMSLKLKGERKRKWGKPVKLLQENGMDGWEYRKNGKFTWQVKDSVLENMQPPCADIVSQKKFRDFKLHLEYKVGNKDGEKPANSGVYLRGRYELQILGKTGEQPHGNMAIYSRKEPKVNPIESPLDTTWQSLDVVFIGRWVTVTLNGQVVHDNEYLDGITGGAFDPWEEKPGPFMLQGDHGKVYFRNIVVTPAK